jgi:uncharacterized membrane protein YeaQ/YmgE (transglycosylase-associated protein family)
MLADRMVIVYQCVLGVVGGVVIEFVISALNRTKHEAACPSLSAPTPIAQPLSLDAIGTIY